MTDETKDARELVDRLYTHGCYWAVSDTASENRARDCDLAADALTAALARAEKAETIDDSCMDTAHITGHKKGWNEAVEAAATLMDEDAEQMKLEGDSDAWTAIEDASVSVP